MQSAGGKLLLVVSEPAPDTELDPHHNRRMESVFLEPCYRWVKAEGVLVFVIPAVALNPCARLLAGQFDHISVFRLEHPECLRFHQFVLLGTFREGHARGEPKGIDALLRARYRPSSIPALKADVAERYVLPPSDPVSIAYTGLPLDDIEDAIERSAKRPRHPSSQAGEAGSGRFDAIFTL